MDGPEQLAIQKLVYNLKHHAAEVKNQFQKELDEEMDVEGTALIFNLLDLLQSGSIDAQKMAEHDRFSGNQFCKARYEGGVAALKARDDKARYSRVTADPTYPAQLQIKKAWRQAVATPGAYDGVKATFAREMLEKALPFIITERRVIDWTRKWGGKLQKQDKREIQQHSRVHSRCLLASQKTS